MKILIDSNGWIEFMGDGKNAVKFEQYTKSARKETHITPGIVIYEVYKRLHTLFGEEKAVEAIAYLIGYTEIIPLDEILAAAAGDISLQLKLAMADAIIKATAEMYGANIITSDPDLKDVGNVVFIPKN